MSTRWGAPPEAFRDGGDVKTSEVEPFAVDDSICPPSAWNDADVPGESTISVHEGPSERVMGENPPGAPIMNARSSFISALLTLLPLPLSACASGDGDASSGSAGDLVASGTSA